MQCSFQHEKNFVITINLTDMAFLMSNFDDFDNDQIWGHPKKVVQRAFQNHLGYHEREKFYYKKHGQRAISEQVFMISGHCQNHQNQTLKRPYQQKKISIQELSLCKNKHYIVVILVPNFHLSTRSSSFFLAFFLLVYGEPF